MRGLLFSLALSTSALLATASTPAHTQPKLPAELRQALQFKLPAAIDCPAFARPVVQPLSTPSLPALLELKRVVADTVARPTRQREVPQRELPGYATTAAVPPDTAKSK